MTNAIWIPAFAGMTYYLIFQESQIAKNKEEAYIDTASIVYKHSAPESP